MKKSFDLIDGKKTKIGVFVMIAYKLICGAFPKLNSIDVGNLPMEDFLLYITTLIGLGHEALKQVKSWKWIQKLLSKKNGKG